MIKNTLTSIITIVTFIHFENAASKGIKGHHHHNYAEYKQRWAPPSICRLDYTDGTSDDFGCFLDNLFDCEPYNKTHHHKLSNNHDDRRTAFWNRLDDLFEDFWGYRSYKNKGRKKRRRNDDEDDDDDDDRTVERVYRCVPRDCSDDDNDDNDDDNCPSQYYSTCEKYHRHPWSFGTGKKGAGGHVGRLGFGRSGRAFGNSGGHHFEHHSSWQDHRSESSHSSSHSSHRSHNHRSSHKDNNDNNDNRNYDDYMFRCTVPSGLAGVQTACRISFDNGTTIFERPCWSSEYWRNNDDDNDDDDRLDDDDNRRRRFHRKYTDYDYVCGNDDDNDDDDFEDSLIQIDGQNRLLTFCHRRGGDNQDGRHHRSDPWRFPWRSSDWPTGFFRQ